jgi:DeoR/GlpR family transcriptional regulator of sugar metabolism
VTNSTTVADLISAAGGSNDQTVILTGGIRTPSAALVGPVADLALRNLHVDQLFLGVHGMDPIAGFTTPNLAEAETQTGPSSQAPTASSSARTPRSGEPSGWPASLPCPPLTF